MTIVVARNVTWNLPHPDKAYAEWLRIIRPGGLILNYDDIKGIGVKAEIFSIHDGEGSITIKGFCQLICFVYHIRRNIDAFSIILSQLGHTVHGIDITPNMIDEANQLAEVERG